MPEKLGQPGWCCRCWDQESAGKYTFILILPALEIMKLFRNPSHRQSAETGAGSGPLHPTVSHYWDSHKRSMVSHSLSSFSFPLDSRRVIFWVGGNKASKFNDLFIRTVTPAASVQSSVKNS